ncbi:MULTISPECIES: SMC-Scp complex subunit ScpB [unclassified Granulicatella]|uniref:SMC-Scp complex subunit ScpB n=1 Tax=unclassified Granulicatella TaxID=2630493 RepID=UPI0010749680|nr:MULTISPECIES: SMC-Scp complex subunit ScpB [unclassified Granulicatella]MBF0780570.1 SMC-Scp complex subunit ScpB [Granulicatella sp. 19428wC4_WM01]TFU94921.1 SMC-Scp complex subunit ScpB [Granulicatella sp. WM01]
MSILGEIESLLFVSGDEGLLLADLVALTRQELSLVEEAIQELQQKYSDDEHSGLALVSFAGRYQLVTKGKYAESIRQYAISPFATKLSQAALETLAIIAYKQPLTRAQIDTIRGVQSSGTLQKLQLRDLIESKGRENSPGKPILYGTTDYFMNYFGITDMNQLPDISNLMENNQEDIQDLFNQRYAQLSESEE